MSAECDVHGYDLVHGENWPEMFCPVCRVEAEKEHLVDALRVMAGWSSSRAAEAGSIGLREFAQKVLREAAIGRFIAGNENPTP